MYPTTPDGRYFVVKGQLWRCTDPSLGETRREALVKALMGARRAVKAAKTAQDQHQLSAARAQVNAAKVALGERGPVWWDDGSPDYNQKQISDTPYAQWFADLQ